MAKTFSQLVSEARENIPLITPQEAEQMVADNPETLIVDVRDGWNIRQTGIISGAAAISGGMLAPRADQATPYRDQRLEDRTRPIITACNVGAIASLGARTLKDMGFSNVYILDGGTKAWKEAGLPVQEYAEL